MFFFVGQVRIIGVEAGGEHGPWLPVSWAKSPMGGNIMSSFEEFLWWKMISERWFLYILRCLFGVFLGVNGQYLLISRRISIVWRCFWGWYSGYMSTQILKDMLHGMPKVPTVHELQASWNLLKTITYRIGEKTVQKHHQKKRMNISQNKVFTQSTYQIWSPYPTSCSRLHHVIWLEGVKTQDNSKDGTETDKHSATLTKGTVGASGLWHEIGKLEGRSGRGSSYFDAGTFVENQKMNRWNCIPKGKKRTCQPKNRLLKTIFTHSNTTFVLGGIGSRCQTNCLDYLLGQFLDFS